VSDDACILFVSIFLPRMQVPIGVEIEKDMKSGKKFMGDSLLIVKRMFPTTASGREIVPKGETGKRAKGLLCLWYLWWI